VLRVVTASEASSIAGTDVVRDFEVGVDRIDLSALPGVLAFGGGSGTPRVVVQVIDGLHAVVRIDTNGSGGFEGKILLTDARGLRAVDFLL
jgi:hypothetical protein